MCERERGEFSNKISLLIQIRLARTQKKKDANTKFELQRGMQYKKMYPFTLDRVM